jgi:uncharacterized protein (DUF433 family)
LSRCERATSFLRTEVAVSLDRITHDPELMGGKPCIRGLRVTVGTVLGLLASGASRERVLQAYPYLEAEDIDAALAYAARPLKAVMDEIGEEAEARGLTPDKLESLLRDE